LSKTAINFMKLLLHPDPNQRLKGDNVFQHPYFEGYKQDSKNEATENLDYAIKSNLNKGEKKNNTKVQPEPIITKETKGEGKAPPTQPSIISNTTNINIINYNYDNDSSTVRTSQEFNKKKEDNNNQNYKKPMNNMVLTTLNFNKKYQENLINLYGYGGTKFDNNFKTFYKGDKYNYEIDLNFKNKPNNKLIAIEEEEDSRKKAKSYPKQPLNYNNNKLKTNEVDFYPSDYHKFPGNKNKKTTIDAKPKLLVYEGKASPNKYPVNSISNKNVMSNVAMSSNFNYNLPNITMKNFKIKK